MQYTFNQDYAGDPVTIMDANGLYWWDVYECDTETGRLVVGRRDAEGNILIDPETDKTIKQEIKTAAPLRIRPRSEDPTEPPAHYKPVAVYEGCTCKVFRSMECPVCGPILKRQLKTELRVIPDATMQPVRQGPSTWEVVSYDPTVWEQLFKEPNGPPILAFWWGQQTCWEKDNQGQLWWGQDPQVHFVLERIVAGRVNDDIVEMRVLRDDEFLVKFKTKSPELEVELCTLLGLSTLSGCVVYDATAMVFRKGITQEGQTTQRTGRSYQVQATLRQYMELFFRQGVTVETCIEDQHCQQQHPQSA